MDTNDPQEKIHKRRGQIVSAIFGALIILLLLLPLLEYPIPPPGQEGITVNLGLPDIGDGAENAGPSAPAVSEPEPQEESTPPPPSEPEQATEPAHEEEVITSDEPDDVAIQEQREKERQRQEELQRQRQEERERQRQEEERRKREAAEQAKKDEANKLKDKLGGLFGGGEGKGNTGKEGNQGDPEGDPNADRLEGISTGGQVGGGLEGRGVRTAPKITDNSQDQGKVAVRVCVDRNGNVISAEFTQRGSTATSSRLKDKAIANAKRWKFSAGSVDRQCGTITYDFRVQ